MMSWNPKFVGGNVWIWNKENALVTVYSAIGRDNFEFEYPERLSDAWWISREEGSEVVDFLCIKTELGEDVILVRMSDPVYEVADSFVGDLISVEEGNRIRNKIREENRTNRQFDGVLYVPYEGNSNDPSKLIVAEQKEIIRQNKRKALAGDAAAQNMVGKYYFEGIISLHPDYAEAARWYRKAAEQGNVDAQNNLGWMYINGYGVKKDEKEAKIWFEKAAEGGCVLALDNLRHYFPSK